MYRHRCYVTPAGLEMQMHKPSASQGALSGQGSQSAWWILALILGLLGAAFGTATLLIWKAFGPTLKQG